MSAWQGRSKGNAFGYRLFIYVLRTFGIRPAYFVLAFVVFYYYLFSHKSSRAILYFFRRMGFGRARSLVMLYRNYYLLGQTLIDKMSVMANIKDTFRFDFEGEEYLREMVAQKKGGLLLSAHAGNWEAAGHLLQRINARIHIVMYDGENEEIKNYMDSVTGDKNFEVIFVKDDLSHIYKINAALANNDIVCIHADRFRPGNKTLSAPFFGEEALFPEGPFLLALKLRVPVAFVYAFKDSATHYHFYSSELQYFYHDKTCTMQDILRTFTGSLESMLRKYPEQWFNYYNFWKH